MYSDDTITEAIIPEKIDDIQVTHLSRTAFNNCINLTNVVLPTTIQSIEWGTFSGCIYLESIELPNELQEIGANAFHSCTSLKTIKLPDNLQSIGVNAFFECTNLEKIKIPDTLKSIPNCTFYGCEKLETVELSNELQEIGEDAFKGCENLKTIKLPDSLKRIEKSAFRECTNLETISISNNMDMIGEQAFIKCSNLKNIELPNTITSIEPATFFQCTKLKTIKMPENLKSIGNNAFCLCTSLESVELPNTVLSIDGSAFSNCTNLKDIKLSDSLVTIGGGAFYNCESLNTIKLPYTLQLIEWNAFDNCTNLEELYIFKDTTFYSGTFNNCSLKDVYYSGSKEEWQEKNMSELFGDSIKNATIHYNLPASDVCGDGVKYQIDGDTLTIYSTGTGTGEMYNYEIEKEGFIYTAPWKDNYEIKQIIIKDGVKNIGNYAFETNSMVNTVKVGNDVTQIGKYAFAKPAASSLNIEFIGNAPNIDYNSFSSPDIETYPVSIYYDKSKSGWNEVIKGSYGNKDLAWIYTDSDARNKLSIEDRWYFNNTRTYFGETYTMLDQDYERLTKNFKWTEKRDIKKAVKKKETKFNGVCGGMTTIMTLVKNKAFFLEDFGFSASTISDVDKNNRPLSEQTISVINFYQWQQSLKKYESEEKRFMNLTQREQFQELENKLENSNNVVAIGYRYKSKDIEKSTENEIKWKNGNHALIGYAIEKGTFKIKINNKPDAPYEEFDRRILIYDPNDLGKEQKYYENAIYYKSDYSLWIRPADNNSGDSAISKNNNFEIKSEDNTAQLKSVIDQVEYLNIVDYKRDMRNTQLFTDCINTTVQKYSLKGNNIECDIEDGLFDGNTTINEINNAVILSPSDSNNTNTNEYYTLMLSETNGDYTITTDEDPIEFNLLNNDYYLEAESDESGTVDFKADGKVGVSTPQSSNTKIAITSNDSLLPWHTIEIENDGVKELSAEWTEEGVVIAGDELKDVKVTGSNDDEEKTLDFTFDVTDEKNSVLIKANDTDTELVVMVDTNNDGTYDTPMDEVKDTPEKPDDKPNNPDDKPNDKPNNPNDKPNNPNTPTKPETLTTNKGRTTLSSNYPRHDVTVSASRGGTVKINTTRATKGTPVQLTVVPETSYVLDELIVKDKDGHTIDVTKKTANLYTFVMPEGQVDIDATFKEKEATKQTPNTVDLPFTDIPADASYIDAVKYVYDNKMMKGDGNETTFNPNGTLTRAMLVTILHRLEDTPQAQPATFNDVAPDAWYHDAIAWASANHVVAGHSPEHFAPSDAITYEQLNTILMRYAKMKDKIPRSYTDGFDNPKAPATRADVAVILRDFMEK